MKSEAKSRLISKTGLDHSTHQKAISLSDNGKKRPTATAARSKKCRTTKDIIESILKLNPHNKL